MKIKDQIMALAYLSEAWGTYVPNVATICYALKLSAVMPKRNKGKWQAGPSMDGSIFMTNGRVGISVAVLDRC